MAEFRNFDKCNINLDEFSNDIKIVCNVFLKTHSFSKFVPIFACRKLAIFSSASVIELQKQFFSIKSSKKISLCACVWIFFIKIDGYISVKIKNVYISVNFWVWLNLAEF